MYEQHQHFYIKPEILDEAKHLHRWFIEIIEKAGEQSKSIDFFQKIKYADKVKDFTWTRLLYHHSFTLPEFILGVYEKEESDDLKRFYYGHYLEEKPHSDWLFNWMLKHEIAAREENLKNLYPNLETNACINYGCRLAFHYNLENWIIGVNCGIEKCSHIFFSAIEPILDNLGLSDKYFKVHVEADEYHSTEGLVFIPKIHPDSARGRFLVDLMLSGISLWCGMLNSWVGIHKIPIFNKNGLLSTTVDIT